MSSRAASAALGQRVHGIAGILLGSEWGEASEEEVRAKEWDKVHCELAEVRVQLIRGADATNAQTCRGG